MAEIGKMIGECKDRRAELGSKMRERERGALGKNQANGGRQGESALDLLYTQDA